MPQGLLDAAQLSTSTEEPALPQYSDEHILRIPTIHVHGLKDPGLELHRKLHGQYCDPDSARLLEWDGEHRIPIGTAQVKAVVEQMYSLAREIGVLARWR